MGFFIFKYTKFKLFNEFLKYFIGFNLFFTFPLYILTLIILNDYYNDLIENSKENLFIRGKALTNELENSIKDRIYTSKKSPEYISYTKKVSNPDSNVNSLKFSWEDNKLYFLYENSTNGILEIWKFKGDFIIDKLLNTDLANPNEIIVLFNRNENIGVSDRIEDNFQISQTILKRIQDSSKNNIFHLVTRSGDGDFIIFIPFPSLPFELVLIHPTYNLYKNIISQLWKHSLAFLILIILITTISYYLSYNLSEKRKEEVKLQNLIENIPLGACLLDKDFKFIIQNKIWNDTITKDPKLWEVIRKEAEFRALASSSHMKNYIWEIKKDKDWEITLSPFSENNNEPDGYVLILRDLSAKKVLFENELELAKNIQKEYLPKETAEIPGIQFYTYYKPYYQVGGDYYDFIQLDNDSALFVMADVAGHGLQAAMMMTVIKVLFLQISSINSKPESILKEMNHSVLSNLPQGKKIVPFHFLILNTKTKEFTYTNAGHPGVIYFPDKTKKEYKIYEKLNPALGLPFPYPENIKIISSNYQSGSRFLLYTDGLLDVINGKDTFDLENILNFSFQNNHLPPKEFSNQLHLKLLEFSKGHPFPDDITWFVIDCY